MTRNETRSTLSKAALLAVVVMGGYGCGGGGTIDTGTGGKTGGGGAIGGLGGRVGGLGGNLGGLGGSPGLGGRTGGIDAGFNMCDLAVPCTAGFTCEQACQVGNVNGTRACMCDATGRLTCLGGAANCIGRDAGPPPPMDAGFNMCTNNTPCTMGFTCSMMCNVNNVPGTRACTCANNGRLNCPAGNAGCIRPDAGPPPDAGTPIDAPRDVLPPVDAPRDVLPPVDAPRDVPPPPVDAPRDVPAAG